MEPEHAVGGPLRERDLGGMMTAVDALLAEVCTDIAAGWAARHDEPVDVLAQDLPALLRDRLLGTSGKRLRPVMCHWGWVASGGARLGRGWDEMIRAGAALDLLHLFALVHDDIMDRSDTRRGKPSIHLVGRTEHVAAGGYGDSELFGDSVALLFGDLALSEAGHLVGGTTAQMRELWRDMLRELVHGQLLDLTGTAARRRDVALARRVARLKSGAYTIQRPLLLGAAAAGADGTTTAALAAYGQHLGEAFALRDDLLGVWGDPASTGKPVGDDLLAGKATVLLATARRLLPEPESSRYLGPGATVAPEDIPALLEMLLERGVRDEVELRVDTEAESARQSLSGADLDPDGVAGLLEMVETVAWRHT